MFIKQIIIQGFKSYKEQTVIEPFSPKTNIIVGRNGSGKSNFFAAIRFVLSDAYSGMGREERQALLHEGSGSAVMTAYVEVIFDNSDGRFPTGKDTLVLRRTIGLKKDEYSLDKKNATKNDVMSLLEAAGFSRSNPYYIVPQGRVTAITNMKDTERLAMLKEVAGTQIYENRRAESEKIMKETENKRAKIDETLKYIKERLEELEGEMKELRDYQNKDRDRRCLEYAYFEREQAIITDKLEEIDNLHQNGTDILDENLEKLQDGEQHVKELGSEIKNSNQMIEMLKRQRAQLEEDRRELARTRAKVELDVKGLSDGLSAKEQAQSEHQAQLKRIKAAIAVKNAELAKIMPEFNKRQSKEIEVQQKLESTKAALERLQSKQGRNQNFKSKAERDKSLRKQIDQSLANQGEQKAVLMDATEQVKIHEQDVTRLEKELSVVQASLESWPATRLALAEKDSAARIKQDTLLNERKLLLREEDNLQVKEGNLRDDYNRARKEMSNMMDRDTAKGIESVRRLKSERNMLGAHGTLAELMKVNIKYHVAVEQVAGNSLFQYVVDDADVATQLVEHLQRTAGGRLTFMPLAQLRKRHSKLPKASDAVPIMERVEFDKKYEPAFSQIFGNTILCENLAIAGQYSRSHGCDAITVDGDKTSNKGALTGGYIDRSKSRLRAVQAINECTSRWEEAKLQLTDIRTKIEKNNQEITDAMSVLQRAEQELRQFDEIGEGIPRELRNKRLEHQLVLKQLQDVRKQRDGADQAMKKVMDDISSLEAEMASEFKKALTANEERQLEQLEKLVRELQDERDQLSERRRDLGRQKSTIEVDLQQNLQPKLDSLNTQDIDATASSSSGDLKMSQGELKRIMKEADEVESRLQHNEQQINDAHDKCQNLQQEKAQIDQELETLAQDIERHQRRMNKSVAKKTALQERAIECQKNIRDLGVLPEEAFSRYQKLESKKIENHLRKVNEDLKKYKHVNKKAVEQYQNFTTQQDTLVKRRKELEDAMLSIDTLIEVLDQRKDEKIERTFKQVSKEFATIFERLVPAGRGSLKIWRKIDQREQHEEGSNDERERPSVENYSGVGISVSFNSKHDEQQRIQQLSGGQKSLCALALVFAIQQCDPAPFYLFDEIDANLDAQYRTAVAQMLASISAQQSQSVDNDDAEDGGMSGQFICTTFRPEMLLVADKCYGVTFHNKTSGINAVSREEALSFVDGEAPK